MKIGFTGTREGMTEAQDNAVCEIIHELWPTECHHGDCVGADGQFVESAWLLRTLSISDEFKHKPTVLIVAHPPTDGKLRAFSNAHETREPKPYLERNHDIVDETDALIAAPRGLKEELRSGTWSTVRYARKQGKPIFIVATDGRVIREGNFG